MREPLLLLNYVRPLPELLVPRALKSSMIPELFAQGDSLHRGGQPIAVSLHRLHHLVEERLVGERDRSAQGVAEQFLAEMPLKNLPALCQQVAAQAVDSLELGTVPEPHLDLNRPAGQV